MLKWSGASGRGSGSCSATLWLLLLRPNSHSPALQISASNGFLCPGLAEVDVPPFNLHSIWFYRTAGRILRGSLMPTYCICTLMKESRSYLIISYQIDKWLRSFQIVIYLWHRVDLFIHYHFQLNVTTYPVWFLQLILRLFLYLFDTQFSLCALLCACPYLYAIIRIICPSCCSLAFSPCHCSANDDEVVLKCPANSARSRCCGGICHLPRKRELESGFGGRTACHCHLLGMLVSRRLYTCNEK